MNLKLLAGLTAAAFLAAGLSYFWGYHKAWDAGRQNLVAQQKQKAQVRLEKQQARQQKDDTRGAAADDKGRTETQTVTREVVKYIQTPGRNVCKFDDARVQLKRRAAENANHIEGDDNE